MRGSRVDTATAPPPTSAHYPTWRHGPRTGEAAGVRCAKIPGRGEDLPARTTPETRPSRCPTRCGWRSGARRSTGAPPSVGPYRLTLTRSGEGDGDATGAERRGRDGGQDRSRGRDGR